MWSHTAGPPTKRVCSRLGSSSLPPRSSVLLEVVLAFVDVPRSRASRSAVSPGLVSSTFVVPVVRVRVVEEAEEEEEEVHRSGVSSGLWSSSFVVQVVLGLVLEVVPGLVPAVVLVVAPLLALVAVDHLCLVPTLQEVVLVLLVVPPLGKSVSPPCVVWVGVAVVCCPGRTASCG